MDFIYRSLVYWAFYNNDQWLFKEDIKPFLEDEGGARNRVKFTQNVIKPLVDQWVGNAVRMDFTARAEAVSDQAFNRREDALQKLKFYSWVAGINPTAKDFIKSKMPISDTEHETESNFENLWQDDYVKAINYLVEAIKDKNDFDVKKPTLAKYLAINGIGIEESVPINGEQTWETIDPIYFGFDRTAKRPDLKDAGYMWRCAMMLDTDIFEQYQDIDPTARELITKFSQLSASGGLDSQLQTIFGSAGRIPVYKCYWKDIEKQEYGYVKDPYGYDLFTQVNKKNDEGKIEGYTTKDLIDAPNEEFGTKILRNGDGDNPTITRVAKKSKFIYVDVLRYCIMIPGEIIGGQVGSTVVQGEGTPNNKADVVLEWGLAPYQETNSLNPSSVEFPFKCQCVNYHEGFILSPIETSISPQRFINRLSTIAQSHISNARGSNVIYDKDFVDAQGGEGEMLRNMNLSKPVGFTGKGRPLNNAVIPYNTNAGASDIWFKLIREIKGVVADVSGVNESMAGTGTNPDALVGVQQLNIERGTLVQEPFYFALKKLLLQCYQCMASQGKRIYAGGQRKLSMMVGDNYAHRITITEDFNNEDFRINIVETGQKKELITAANEKLTTYLQLGLVTKNVFVKYYGISTDSDIRMALHESVKEQSQMAKLQQPQQEAQVARAKQEQSDQIQGEYQHQTNMQNLKNEGKLDETIVKVAGTNKNQKRSGVLK